MGRRGPSEASQRFYELLRAHTPRGRKRARAEHYWSALEEFGSFETPKRKVRNLARLFQQLEHYGQVAFPQSRHLFQSSYGRILPDYVTFKSDTPVMPALKPQAPRKKNSSKKTNRFIKYIHDQHAAGAFQRPATWKYRSLQLTGSERNLKYSVPKVQRFDNDPRALLNLVEYPQQPSDFRIGDGTRILFVENKQPHNLITATMLKLHSPAWNRIIHSGGVSPTHILKQIAETASPPVTSIHYLGDFDAAGLQIALAFRRIGATNCLPPVQPAALLHQLMFDAAESLGYPFGFKQENTNVKRPELASLNKLVLFLAPRHRVAATTILGKGNRIPEEVLEIALLDLLDGNPGALSNTFNG